MKNFLYNLLFKKIVDKELEELSIAKDESIQFVSNGVISLEQETNKLKNKLSELITIVDNLDIEKLNAELLSRKLDALRAGL